MKSGSELLALLSQHEGRKGIMVLTREGVIKKSLGELKDRQDIAFGIIAMLRDAGDLLGDEAGEFRRLCLSYEAFQYAVQLSPAGDEVFVVKDSKG